MAQEYSNEHEQAALQSRERRDTNIFDACRRERRIECRIVMPDHTMYCLTMSEDCKGADCLQQICDILGIAESDYFGLYYRDRVSKFDIWINKRIKLKSQVKSRPPYSLKFRVKYFTDPELILQPYTLTAFYKDLKYQIMRGDIQVPDQKMGVIGACMAQVDLGDPTPHCTSGTAYPAYFPGWSAAVANATTKEHEKLKGQSRFEVIGKFLKEVYQLEQCGVCQTKGWMDGQWVTVHTGGRQLCLLDNQAVCLRRVPYVALSMVSFGSNFFGFNYHCRGDDGNPAEQKCKIIVRSYLVARNLFRAVTEEQVFFYQKIVPAQVKNHVERRHKRLKKFCCKVLRVQFEVDYYYDIERTKMEAYRHAWQKLHQVDQTAMDQSATPLQPHLWAEEVAGSTSDNGSSSPADKDDSKTALIWGLSSTTSAIAKELLPESQLALSVSEELLGSIGGGANQEGEGEGVAKSLQPLSKAQGKKLRQLLLNIQDERVCQVCMNELTSSVFCPCGHHVACYHCAKQLDKCPVCRQLVGYVQYVYGSA